MLCASTVAKSQHAPFGHPRPPYHLPPAFLCLHPAQSPSGFDKTGPYRARFILEALADLRARLREAGSDLLVRLGKPGEVLGRVGVG